MDLRQLKLTGEEWDALEVLVPAGELEILKLVNSGYTDVNKRHNKTLSLVGFMRLSGDLRLYHDYFYSEYFYGPLEALGRLRGCPAPTPPKPKKKKAPKLKKAALIRIANSNKKLAKMKDTIFEFILIAHLKAFLKEGMRGHRSNYHFYTLVQLMEFHVAEVNSHMRSHLTRVTEHFAPRLDKAELVENSYEFMERNRDLSRYKDIQLYEHQKKLFTLSKSVGPKLILYQAPTGTGKTVSPVGLVKGHKLIFVCAAKHVGMQLAKACISLNIKIAVAFGCSDPGGIRLHYFAAKDYQRNRRTGGIFRVDNSVGDDVEIVISDIQSYLPAMRYMLAFNPPERLVWYWDEPTITLDYKDHAYHSILRRNWADNEIPNVILSSATLPSREEIMPCILSFASRFAGAEIHSIVSHDCSKTIPIIDSKGYIVLPHFIYSDYGRLCESLDHIEQYQTLLRHFDLSEITRLIGYLNEGNRIPPRYEVDSYFDHVRDITSVNVKRYYLKLLRSLKTNYAEVFAYFQETREPHHLSNIYVATKDAHTLTGGPTIFLVDKTETVAKFCFKTAKIPKDTLAKILKDIQFNDKLRAVIDSLEHDLVKNQDAEEQSDRRKGSTKPSKTEKTKKDMGRDPRLAEIRARLESRRAAVRKIQLAERYIPNSRGHRRVWGKDDAHDAFCSSIDDATIEKIMLLAVEPMWKILLMMGIGVFAGHECVDYTAIMRSLAQAQKLYLIIASTDYIYGTNYQFCHGYIGKDLGDLTQEKTIQAFGRVGRSSAQHDYSIRLRNDALIDRILLKEGEKLEAENMNRLFGLS